MPVSPGDFSQHPTIPKEQHSYSESTTEVKTQVETIARFPSALSSRATKKKRCKSCGAFPSKQNGVMLRQPKFDPKSPIVFRRRVGDRSNSANHATSNGGSGLG